MNEVVLRLFKNWLYGKALDDFISVSDNVSILDTFLLSKMLKIDLFEKIKESLRGCELSLFITLRGFVLLILINLDTQLIHLEHYNDKSKTPNYFYLLGYYSEEGLFGTKKDIENAKKNKHPESIYKYAWF